MEIDEAAGGPRDAVQESTSVKHAAAKPVQLKEDDPFDLEQYIGQYADRRRIERLLFIARSCPSLRVKAYQQALDAIKIYSLDYKLYQEVANECSEVQVDELWMEDARVKQESGLEKLDVELKNYQNNLIKESIRMGYRDIGDFQRKTGDATAAIKSYAKSKEYCTTSQHILDMSLSVVDTALDQMSYATVKNYALKAESALEHVNAPAKGQASTVDRNVNLPGMVNAGPGKKEEESRSKHFQLMSEKLSVALAVSNLGQAEFTKAARGFLHVSAPQPTAATSSSRDSAATNTTHYISHGDIGLYGVLCGMASFDRDQFKRMILDNANLRPYLEHNPFLKDLILKHYSSKFLQALQILEENMSRLLLDIHLSKHVGTIVDRIKDRMLELYFEPYRSVKFEKMATNFGMDLPALQSQVTRLIKRGTLKARINSRDQTLEAHAPQERDVLYQHALKLADQNSRASRAVSYRMRLIQSDLIVDAKKNSTQAPPNQGNSKGGRTAGSKEKAQESIEV